MMNEWSRVKCFWLDNEWVLKLFQHSIKITFVVAINAPGCCITLHLGVMNNMRVLAPERLMLGRQNIFWHAKPDLTFYSLFTQTRLMMCSRCMSRFRPHMKQNITVVILSEKFQLRIQSNSAVFPTFPGFPPSSITPRTPGGTAGLIHSNIIVI